MGRPKASREQKRARVVAGKLTESEGAAWDELRRQLGGGGRFTPTESEVLRMLIGDECRRRGIAWPDEAAMWSVMAEHADQRTAKPTGASTETAPAPPAVAASKQERTRTGA